MPYYNIHTDTVARALLFALFLTRTLAISRFPCSRTHTITLSTARLRACLHVRTHSCTQVFLFTLAVLETDASFEYLGALRVLRTIADAGHLLSDGFLAVVERMIGELPDGGGWAGGMHRSLWKGFTLPGALADCEALLRDTSHLIGHPVLDASGGERKPILSCHIAHNTHL